VTPSVAVVLCTRDRPELLAGALPGLVGAHDAGADVVVVDSASRGPETARLAGEAGLRVVRCDRPGASRARNAGLAATTGDVVVFTDDDCRPATGWADLLAAAITADPAVGFATGRVEPGEGEGRAMSPMVDEEPARFTVADDIGRMGHGANMAFRRTALEAVGGFDEWLGAGVPLRGSEDKDAFWRVLHAGWAGCYVPSAVVAHAAWRGPAESLRTGYYYGLGIGGRAVKVARIDGESWRSAVAAAASSTWRQAGAELRARHRFATGNLAVRGLGIWVGGLRASRYAVRDGHFTR
jgi:glycosyltransferase involved in cell wall biosynthesis